jgi:DNA polymerase
MNQLAEHLRFYQELGVTGISRDPRWRKRESAGLANASADAALPPEIIPVTLARSSVEVLAAIREDLGDCTRCKLHTQGRTQIVFGVGNPKAEIMFVGEAPGADEDEQGVPFVGRAGQLLTKMIEAMGLRRDDVYIANVLKCRPPGNRNPEPDEIQTCQPFLFRQVASIQPRVVIALGAFAARTLLDSEEPISKLRGRVVWDCRSPRRTRSTAAVPSRRAFVPVLPGCQASSRGADRVAHLISRAFPRRRPRPECSRPLPRPSPRCRCRWRVA